MSLSELTKVVAFDVIDGHSDPANFGNYDVIVPEQWAINLGLRAGDTFVVAPLQGGPALTLHVAAVVKTVPTERPTFLIDRDLALRAWGAATDETVLVEPAGALPAGAGDLYAALAGLQAEYPEAELVDVAASRAQFMQKFGQRLAIVVAAVAVILTVAGASLVALIAAVLAGRRREFAMLRAAGATRRQTGLLVALELLLICAAGGVLAIAIGAAITWALLRTMGAVSAVPSAGAAAGSLLAVYALTLLVVRIGTQYLNRSSIALALRAD